MENKASVEDPLVVINRIFQRCCHVYRKKGKRKEFKVIILETYKEDVLKFLTIVTDKQGFKIVESTIGKIDQKILLLKGG